MGKGTRKSDKSELAALSWSLHAPDVQSLFSMPVENRYQHFVLMVRQTREVWILESEAEKPCIVQADPEYLPLFPSSESALAFSKLHPKFKPRSLTYNEFIQYWLPGMARDGINAGVVPNLEVTLWAMHPLKLKYVLEA